MGFSASVGSGLMYYQGDLSETNFFPKKQYYPFLHVSVSKEVSNVIALRLGFMKGQVGAADSLTSRKDVRDFHFRSPINDFHLLLGLNLKEMWLSMKKDKGLRKRLDHLEVLSGPKLLIGGGYFNFNPRAKYRDTWHKLNPLGTEGQNIGGDYPDPYKLWQFNLKAGAEIGFRLNRHLQLDLYGVYTILFTDYLDDVSGDFPDYNELINAPNGKLAARYTYRLKNRSTPAKGSKRGNPDINDSYVNAGIKLTYFFSKAQLDRIRP